MDEPGEAGPVSDFHGQPEACRHLNAPQAHQCVYHRGVAARLGGYGHLLVDAFEVPCKQLCLLGIGLVGELQRDSSKHWRCSHRLCSFVHLLHLG
jgi:hypothetical protein